MEGRCLSYFTVLIIIILMETIKDIYISAQGIVSKRLGSRYRSGRPKDWLKFKNPAAPAVKREAEGFSAGGDGGGRAPANWPAPLSYSETVTLISDTPRILTFVPDTRRVKSSSA
jgi:hypothetical protein